MLEINGIPPRLNGQECEGLICQQYWYQGKLVSEVDALSIKTNGRWYTLYFENGIIYWRMLNEAPSPYKHQDSDPFTYPHIDLGDKYGINSQIIDECVAESMPNGSRVVISFERSGKLVVSCIDDQTRIQYIASG